MRGDALISPQKHPEALRSPQKQSDALRNNQKLTFVDETLEADEVDGASEAGEHGLRLERARGRRVHGARGRVVLEGAQPRGAEVRRAHGDEEREEDSVRGARERTPS